MHAPPQKKSQKNNNEKNPLMMIFVDLVAFFGKFDPLIRPVHESL